MEVADETITDDNHDTASSCKLSTSGSDGEVGDNQPGSSGEPSATNDKEKLCNGSRSGQLSEPQPWIPTMSLLDLAHRLKQAEMRVLGMMQRNAAQLDEQCSGDDSMESSPEKRFFSSDENSKHGRFDTPTENSTGCTQKGNVLSPFLDIKTETLSDSNMDDSAFDQSKTTEFSSLCGENSNFDAYKRHQCAWCDYRTDSKSHLLRHQKRVHQFVMPIDSSGAAVSLSMSFDRSAEMEMGKTDSNSRSLRRHRCELCSYQTDSKSHLRRHQGSVHSTKKPYRCHLCRMEFSRSEKAKEHFMNLHSDVPYDSRKMRKFLPTTKEPNKTTVDTFTKIKLLYKDLDPEKNSNNGTKALKKDMKDVNNDADEDNDELSVSEQLQEKNRSFGSRGDGSKPYMCLKCDYASRDIWHLKRHISDVHLMRKDFKCKICNYATNRQHRFICHMRTHGEIFCFYCDYSNIKLDVFKQHLQLCSALHKMATEVQCRLCELDCMDHASLKEHMSTVHGAVLYSCGECSYYTEIFEDFESHSQIHREEERTCKLCNVVFETKQDLNVHCNAVHIRAGEGRLLTCVVCQHQEPDRLAMYEHVHQHTPQMFFCTGNDCSFKSTTSKSLVLHCKYYHNRNQTDAAPANVREPQPGPSSSMRLRDTSMLKSAALGTYSCPICTERPPFRYRKSFEKHMTQHAVESESCPLCQDTFFLHKELQEHALAIHGVKVV